MRGLLMEYENLTSKDIMPTDLYELMILIDDFFGYKAINTTVFPDRKALKYILYDSFEWEFILDERYGTFHACLAIGNGYHQFSEILGEEVSSDNNEKSVKESLKLIDKYCRLRLPDKFLEEFDKMRRNCSCG